MGVAGRRSGIRRQEKRLDMSLGTFSIHMQPEAAGGRSKLIGVTVLTSLNDSDIHAVGFDQAQGTDGHVVSMSKLTQDCGLDGVVCSPRDIESVKAATSEDFLTIVPGIRPAQSDVADQKRIATPGAAVQAGADIIVVGRAITKSADPAAAATAVFAEVEAARG